MGLTQPQASSLSVTLSRVWRRVSSVSSVAPPAMRRVAIGGWNGSRSMMPPLQEGLGHQGYFPPDPGAPEATGEGAWPSGRQPRTQEVQAERALALCPPVTSHCLSPLPAVPEARSVLLLISCAQLSLSPQVRPQLPVLSPPPTQPAMVDKAHQPILGSTKSTQDGPVAFAGDCGQAPSSVSISCSVFPGLLLAVGQSPFSTVP